jgi:hypothetical protein
MSTGAVIAAPGGIPSWLIYFRGAMAIHALRNAVGDDRFFRLLRVSVREQGGGHVTIQEFIATAERVTRMQLDDLFETWLFTPSKPEGIETAPSAAALRAAPGWDLPGHTRSDDRSRPSHGPREKRTSERRRL